MTVLSRTLALKMIRKLRLWLEMVRAFREGGRAHVCHQWAQSREKQTLSPCRWVRGRDRAPSASVACQLLLRGALGKRGTGWSAIMPHFASPVGVGMSCLDNSCKQGRFTKTSSFYP